MTLNTNEEYMQYIENELAKYNIIQFHGDTHLIKSQIAGCKILYAIPHYEIQRTINKYIIVKSPTNFETVGIDIISIDPFHVAILLPPSEVHIKPVTNELEQKIISACGILTSTRKYALDVSYSDVDQFYDGLEKLSTIKIEHYFTDLDKNDRVYRGTFTIDVQKIKEIFESIPIRDICTKNKIKKNLEINLTGIL